MSLQELEQDPFDADEFVERLAWRATGGVRTNSETFDPIVLHAAFEKTIKELKEMNQNILQQVNHMQTECNDEEIAHWQRIAELHKHNQIAFTHFKALDERINFVATKVVHLGDQLEGVNTPRMRAAEAQMLMTYFSEFLEEKKLSRLFEDPFQVEQAADIIQKLFLISQELPGDGKFDSARRRIEETHSNIERHLIEDFRRAYFDGDTQRMKRIAEVLSHFKGYEDCINIFIEESQKEAFKKPVIFDDIPQLCARTSTLVNEVFSAPETVMAKLLLNIYNGKLMSFLKSQLSDKSDLEKHLTNLQNLYVRTISLCEQLSCYCAGNDTLLLSKVTKSIFNQYLESYISDEMKFLKEKSSLILQKYYDSRGHQRKNIQTGGIYDLRRDIQAVIGAHSTFNLGPAIENYGGETFLSQEVVINLLQEYKMAFKRCHLLCKGSEVAGSAAKIFELLVQYLCEEHIDYAVELGLHAIPLADPKTEPKIFFLDVVGQTNTIFHLFEKQFTDCLLPLVSGSVRHRECIQRKREILDTIENKLDLGLDRTLTSMVGWIKYLLTTEQKKTDFKPETEEGPLQMFSTACEKVVKYIKSVLDTMHLGLDGKNIDAVLTEFGVRLHRVIFDHLQQFQYSYIGAMLVICDVNEYRKCVKEFQIPLVTQLFNTLHALCNLLVVVPENLKQVCSGEELAGLEKATLVSFVQLRVDYKTAKLHTSRI